MWPVCANIHCEFVCSLFLLRLVFLMSRTRKSRAIAIILYSRYMYYSFFRMDNKVSSFVRKYEWFSLFSFLSSSKKKRRLEKKASATDDILLLISFNCWQYQYLTKFNHIPNPYLLIIEENPAPRDQESSVKKWLSLMSNLN